jgi:hypothetical protein
MFIKEISCTAILSVVTMSCMTINLNAPYIDYRLEPYVKSFIYEANKHGVNVDIGRLIVKIDRIIDKDNKDSDTIGLCNMSNRLKEITIDSEYAKSGNLEEVIYHEMGHCVLNREHCITKINKKRVSLMYPYIEDDNDYASNRERYIKELFNEDERCVNTED